VKLLPAIHIVFAATFLGLSVSNATDRSWIDKTQRPAYEREMERLQSDLKGTEKAGELRSKLSEQGYEITSVNANTDNNLEYEIAGNGQSFEVHVAVADGEINEVTVMSNIWPAKATRRAMATPENKQARVSDFEQVTGDKYRDSRRWPQWTSEREKLESSLKTGQTLGDHEETLEKLGYEITAINDTDVSSREYEVVRGQQTFEIQAEMNKVSKVVSQVSVMPNVWLADATERALAVD